MTGRWADTVRGCLLGGAVGDALGADIEFDSWDEIRRRFGDRGVTGYPGGVGHVTDDTQMTLFTAEGLIRAHHAARLGGAANAVEVLHASYRRWLVTQQHHPDEVFLGTVGAVDVQLRSGWLVTRRELWRPRSPGLTCIGALSAGVMGRPGHPINDSKGCGGVMRVAPIGLVASEPFALGVAAAAITHTHPTGFLAAGVLARVVAGLAAGSEPLDAIGAAAMELRFWPEHEETLAAVRSAVELAARHPVPDPARVAELGGGWVAEEALAIALYCTLCATSFRHGVLAAVNHSGDSDSTGAIAGNLLGLRFGVEGIPAEWVQHLAERDVVECVADDLALAFPRGDDEEPPWSADALAERYPAG